MVQPLDQCVCVFSQSGKSISQFFIHIYHSFLNAQTTPSLAVPQLSSVTLSHYFTNSSEITLSCNIPQKVLFSCTGLSKIHLRAWMLCMIHPCRSSFFIFLYQHFEGPWSFSIVQKLNNDVNICKLSFFISFYHHFEVPGSFMTLFVCVWSVAQVSLHFFTFSPPVCVHTVLVILICFQGQTSQRESSFSCATNCVTCSTEESTSVKRHTGNCVNETHLLFVCGWFQ